MKWLYRQREARVLYSPTTDQQSVTYWARNHLLIRNHLFIRIYFDFNGQETTKRQVSPSGVSTCPPIHEKESHQEI